MTVDELAKVYPKLSFQTQNDDNTTPPVQEVIQTHSVHNRYGNRYLNPPIEPFGGDKPHNNLQPSRVCYIWIRTA